jgi:hypothetical protein
MVNKNKIKIFRKWVRKYKEKLEKALEIT